MLFHGIQQFYMIYGAAILYNATLICSCLHRDVEESLDICV